MIGVERHTKSENDHSPGRMATNMPRLVGLVVMALLFSSGRLGVSGVHLALAGAFLPEPTSSGLELAAREALADELRPLQHRLRTEHPDVFAGLWIDDSGRPHIALVARASKVLGIVDDAGLSVPPIIEDAEFSESDLRAQLEELRKAYVDWPDGSRYVESIEVSTVALDLRQNRIAVNVLSGTPDEVAVLASRFGPAILTERVETKPAPVACTSRANCGGPMKAGLNLYYINDERACQTAFQVFSGSTNYILTAGHCHHDSRNTRYHPIGVKIGAQDAYSVSGRADAMRIFLSSTSSVSNKLFLSPTNIPSITSAEQIAGPGAEVVGEPVCTSKPSGNRCGTLYIQEIDIPGLIDQRLARDLYGCDGDSGSPVYYGSKAIGIVVQTGIPQCSTQPRDTFYSHIYWVQDILNVALRIN